MKDKAMTTDNGKNQDAAIDSRIPWGPVGYVTYKRTYARPYDPRDPLSPTEEFPETVERVLKACSDQLKLFLTTEETSRLRSYFLELKASVAGRFLWQLGSETVDRLGLMSLQNCAFVAVDGPIHPFTWAFDALLLGVGVGFSIEKQYVEKIPAPDMVHIARQDGPHADFIIPDQREGWTELLERILRAHFITKEGFTYSAHLIRPAGSPIYTYGGIAAGPESLCSGMQQIHDLLNQAASQDLRPMDCLDIMNILGAIVARSSTRRSAQMAIGDADDVAFLKAKRWDLKILPPWRSQSNNSVVCKAIEDLPESFWETYQGHAEPYGLINLPLARSVGRLGDTRYPDPQVCGFNPCGEQALENKETCALAEIFLPRIASMAEFTDISQLLYRIVKHSLALPCHHKDTESIVHRNMRMGIGMTGYLQATEEQRSWLPLVYENLRTYDERYAASHGWPRSIKLTTCKPSGTLSLLPGVTPGVHPGFSRYFIRRLRFPAQSPLAVLCREHGYPTEDEVQIDGSLNPDTWVVSFPCSYPAETPLTESLSAIEQLENVRRIQRDWSDNAVSATVYYQIDELSAIRAWLEKHYQNSIKSISFFLRRQHGFQQPPYEAISREAYFDLMSRVTPIEMATGIGLYEFHPLYDDSDCGSEACPVD